MTTIARRVGGPPLRTASDSWTRIVELLTAPLNDDAVSTALGQAGDAAAMLIAEEHTADAPVVVSGFGPQVRIYTVHGPDALDNTRLNEHDLPLTASNDWTLALPATGLDLELARSALAGVDHVEVYDAANEPAPTHAHKNDPTNDEIVIDLSALEA